MALEAMDRSQKIWLGVFFLTAVTIMIIIATIALRPRLFDEYSSLYFGLVSLNIFSCIWLIVRSHFQKVSEKQKTCWLIFCLLQIVTVALNPVTRLFPAYSAYDLAAFITLALISLALALYLVMENRFAWWAVLLGGSAFLFGQWWFVAFLFLRFLLILRL